METKENEQIWRDKHDELFKQLLEIFFYEFIDLFFPRVSRLMDRDHLEFRPRNHHRRLGSGKACNGYPGGDTAQGRRGLDSGTRREPVPAGPGLQPEDVQVLRPALRIRKESWRDYIRSNNPVAAALLSKMDYNEEEKVSVKIEFARMLANLRLDLARSTLLTAFFETYLHLSVIEEQEYRKRLPRELDPEGVKSFMQITTSYHEKGRKEGKLEEKKRLPWRR